jgi:hypothetical protein
VANSLRLKIGVCYSKHGEELVAFALGFARLLQAEAIPLLLTVNFALRGRRFFLSLIAFRSRVCELFAKQSPCLLGFALPRVVLLLCSALAFASQILHRGEAILAANS